MAPGAAGYSRKQLDELAEQAKALGARGLYTVKVAAEGVTSALEKTLGAAGVAGDGSCDGGKARRLDRGRVRAEQIPGTDAAALIAGQLRLALAERLNLVPKDRWEFLWLTGLSAVRMERDGKELGAGAASFHRDRGRGSGQDWNRSRRTCARRAMTWF